MAENKSFYKNVFLLTQLVVPSNDFKKYFKEGMFDKPNTVGFIHVSHFLLSIYDEERFKKAVEWPILEKKAEAKYRNEVRDFMNIIALENSDIDFPPIQTSHLLHAGGSKFINLMWKLSQVVVKSFIKRERPGSINAAPKRRPCNELSKKFLNNLIADDTQKLLDFHQRVQKIERRARDATLEMAKTVEKNHPETFEVRQRLSSICADAPVHPDIKTRIADPNDKEIMDLWKNNIRVGLNYIKAKTESLVEITESSENVSSMVKSILSNDSNCLDAKNLPKIDVKKVLELPGLRPEMHVALHHLYEDEKLDLSNMMIVLNSMLQVLETNMSNHEFPDLTECNLQIEASIEDLKSMCNVVDNIQMTVMNLTKEIKSQESNVVKKSHNMSMHMCQSVFDTVVLKSSPTIQFNSNSYDSEKNDIQERLELTPVEGTHKSLFLRYRDNENPFAVRVPKIRPKMLISRINLEDTLSSINERPSPSKRLVIPRSLNQSTNTTISGKFSRLFAGVNRTIPANCSITSTGSWKMSTIVDSSVAGDICNMSPKSSFNISREFFTPEKPSVRLANPSTSQFERPEFNSTEIVPDLKTIDENTEIKISMGQSPKPKQIEKRGTKNNDRRSISDLVERYKKIREKSGVYMENSNETLDDSERC